MQTKEIIILGDSIVWGAYDFGGGWARRFRSHLNNLNSDGIIHIWGSHGMTTQGLLDNFDKKMKGRRATDIIFGIGANDTQIIRGKNKVSDNEFKKNIYALVERGRMHADHVVFMGLSRVNEPVERFSLWRRVRWFSNDAMARYDSLLERFTRENECGYIPISDIFSAGENIFIDGVHPNSKGHARIAERVAQFFLSSGSNTGQMM